MTPHFSRDAHCSRLLQCLCHTHELVPDVFFSPCARSAMACAAMPLACAGAVCGRCKAVAVRARQAARLAVHHAWLTKNVAPGPAGRAHAARAAGVRVPVNKTRTYTHFPSENPENPSRTAGRARPLRHGCRARSRRDVLTNPRKFSSCPLHASHARMRRPRTIKTPARQFVLRQTNKCLPARKAAWQAAHAAPGRAARDVISSIVSKARHKHAPAGSARASS